MAPVTVRRLSPCTGMSQGAIRTTLEAEADRWGMYGHVDAVRLDRDGHPTVTVTPRGAQTAAALAGALATADRRRTHTTVDQEP